MKPIFSAISQNIAQEQHNLWLWVPILFAFGVVFSISFAAGFLSHYLLLLFLFFAAVFFSYLNRNSYRSLIYLAVAIFLTGGFYVIFYQKIFLNQTPITGKFYVDGIGKIESINKFYNPVTHISGASLVIANPVLYKAEFLPKKLVTKKIHKKKVRKKSAKKRQSQKEKAAALGLTMAEYKERKAIEKIKKAAEKLHKKQQKAQEKIIKNFVNLEEYQEIDRRFLEINQNYQEINWQEERGRMRFPGTLKKVLITLPKYQNNLAVNDVIAIRMALHPPEDREFPNDYDLKINALATKITAYGYGFGELKILKKAEISTLDEYFINLREIIRNKILATINRDSGEIAIALLIGDQKGISEKLLSDIRSSGLAHLLSISGFHLSLMATISLGLIRFLLSRSQYLALNFDLKKIAAFFALIITYSYLKIAGSPLPAQRSFLMVAFVLIAIFLSEKINAKRIILASFFLMTLANPYNIFNIGLQLSFLAVLVLVAFYEKFQSRLNLEKDQNIFSKIFWYFIIIILTSITIQIASTPLLMYSFGNISLLGFIANITAIPLASFFVMPLGFLALFLMPFHLEKYALILMKSGIILIEKISTAVANMNYSHFISPEMPSFGVILAMIGILLICLSQSRIWILGMILFLLSFATIYFTTKPAIAFNREQKFFATYDQKNGLLFSKKLRPSKLRERWMKEFREGEFKYLNCGEKKCLVEAAGKKFLVLFKRNKIKEICEDNFDVIVNMTRKYALPNCIGNDKMQVDNLDFFTKGGWFFYFRNNGLEIKNSM